MNPGNNPVALPIHVDNAKAFINYRLVGIGCRPVQIIKCKSSKDTVLRANLIVQSNRKLISIGRYLRGGSVGIHTKCTLREVRQRITSKDIGDRRIDGYGKRIAWKSRRINSDSLLLGWNGEHLSCALDLPEALILHVVKQFSSAVVNVRDKNRTTIGKSELLPLERRNAARIDGRRVVEGVAGI